MLFDTHCHINDKAYDGDRSEVLSRAAEAGVDTMLCPATDMATSRACIDLANACDGVYAAVGIHPELAATASRTMQSDFVSGYAVRKRSSPSAKWDWTTMAGAGQGNPAGRVHRHGKARR